MSSYDEFPPEWIEGEGVTLEETLVEDDDDLPSLGSASEVEETNLDTFSTSSDDSDELGWLLEHEGEEELLDELLFAGMNDASPLRDIPNPGFNREGVQCTVDFKPGKKVVDFFFMIFPLYLIDNWVKYTNENMTKYFGDRPRVFHGKPCPDVQRREMLALIGIFLIVGVAHIRCLRDAYRYAIVFNMEVKCT